MKQIKIYHTSFWTSYLLVCLLLGILSQVEILRNIFRPILYCVWFLLILLYVSKHHNQILMTKHARIFAVMVAVTFSWRFVLMLGGVINSIPQLGTLLLVDLAAFLYGCWLAYDGIAPSSLSKVLIYYSIAVAVFAIYLFKTYFSSIGAWIDTVIYQYASKNSAAQLLAQSVLFLLFLFPSVYKKKVNITGQLIRFGIIVWLLMMIAILRCRTAMLALAIAAVYYVLRRGGKHRIWYIGAFILAVLLALAIDPLRNFLESALLLNKYGQGATLDQLSSGRVTNFEAAVAVWMEHPWVGVGRILIDCNPLALLADSGIIGAIPYFVIWLSTVKVNLFRNNNEPISKVVELLTVYYCVSALLEGYPPFGPGVCVTPFWLLSGYNEVRKIKHKISI